MRASVLVGVVVLTVSPAVHAQSLGEVARQEEARRKAIAKPAKVYTNDSLRGRDLPPSTVTPAPAPAPAVAAPDADDPAGDQQDAAPSPPRDEKYWRGRIDAARTALSRAQIVRDALQTRINSLAADFVNRDDPAQRNVIAADRQKALAELDRLEQEIAAQQKAIVDIQDEARRANVPAGWVR